MKGQQRETAGLDARFTETVINRQVVGAADRLGRRERLTAGQQTGCQNKPIKKSGTNDS